MAAATTPPVLPWDQKVANLQRPRPGIVFAEEAAIMRRLSTLSVRDDRNDQRVCQVFFDYPERETEKYFPFFTISFIGLSHNTDAQISETQYYYTTQTNGMTPEQISRFSEFNYYPSETNQAGMDVLAQSGGFLTADSFVPVNLLFQITSYCRGVSHDHQLIGLMLTHVTPFRRGFIEVPEDGTIRRFDLINWTSSNALDQEADYNKRIFRRHYTLQMSAELPASAINGTMQALSVQGLLNVEHQDNITVNDNFDLTEAFT